MVERRLARLRGDRTHFAILALDHGLTHGDSEDVIRLPVSGLINSVHPHVGAVVMNYGLARKQRSWPHNLGLILQCFSGPSGRPRFQVASVEQALHLDAVGVSVQVGDTFAIDDLVALGDFTRVAHEAGLPVLFMVNGVGVGDTMLDAIRRCDEMGADLIKVALDDSALAEAARLHSLLGGSAPVLMAGGPLRSDLLEHAAAAAKIGFSGYCIGRNIYTNPSPTDTIIGINRVFDQS